MSIYRSFDFMPSSLEDTKNISTRIVKTLIENPPPWVTLYSGGDVLAIDNTFGSDVSWQLIDRLVQGEKPVLVFDIDGTLMEWGLEVWTKKQKTVSGYITDNIQEIEKFREKLRYIKTVYDWEVVICTGRGRVFAQMIGEVFFGEGLVDKIICEWGGMILDGVSIRIVPDVEKNLPEIRKIQESLIEYVTKNLWGTFEEGKDICLSFNPPDSISMSDFRTRIEEFISSQEVDSSKIYITNSNSAVDINPQWIDKLIAMQLEIPDGVIVYFGDANNDRSAMEHFSHINITPSNASAELIQEVVMQSGGSSEKRSALWIKTDAQEIYGVNKGIDAISQLYDLSMKGGYVYWLTQRISKGISQVVNLEIDDRYTSYVALLDSLHGSSSLEQKNQPFYDKIFYLAKDISWAQEDGYNIDIPHNSFVRLNDKIPVTELPTVNELRSGKEKWVLFSGVAAIQLQTSDGIRIPLLRRDKWAPTDPNKYTLPAGRADKSPWKVAYEELIEELVIFGKIDGKLVQIIPELPDVSREKIYILASVARDTYVKSLINRWSDLIDILPYIQADFSYVPLSVSSGGTEIVTRFIDENGNSESVTESGFFPLHDIWVNTYEMIRGFTMNLRNFSDIEVGDGDGFWRDATLFTIQDLSALTDIDITSSVKHVIEKKLFLR